MKYIKLYRITKHSIQYLFTQRLMYKYEVEHYYYMKKFKSE